MRSVILRLVLMHASRLLLSLLLAAAFTPACDAPCNPSPESAGVRLRDSLDNPLAIDAAEILLGKTREPCTVFDKRSGFATCPLREPGLHTIEVSTQGHIVRQELEVKLLEECHLSGVTGLVIVYDGPACVPALLTVAQGELLDPAGNPYPAQVSIRTGNSSAECSVEDNQYSCPALDATSTDYTVTARFGTTYLTRKLDVPLSECSLEAPEHLPFDLSHWPCEDVEAPRDAARVTVRTRSAPAAMPKNALADHVTARDAGGREQTCRLEPTQRTPAAPTYLCAPTTPRGGGRYTFEAALGAATASAEALIQDDGCQPITASVDLVIEL